MRTRSSKKIKLKRASKNMISEKALDLIGKYLILSIIIILIGLLFSNESGRGFPIPWYTEAGIDGNKFLISFLIIGLVVRVADIIARISSLREKVYRTPYKATDSIIANSSSGIIINGCDDYEDADPAVEESSNVKPARVEEKKFTPRLNSRPFHAKRKPIAISIFSCGLIIMIMLSVIFSIIGRHNRDFDDNTYDYYNDDYYEEYHGPLYDIAASALEDSILYEDEDFLSQIGDNNVHEFYDYIDWATLDLDSYFYLIESLDDDESSGVVKFSIMDNDYQTYILAIKLARTDVYADDYEIVGVSICKNVFESELYSYDFSPDSYSNEEWEDILSIVSNDSITVGDGEIEGESIITWNGI